MLRRSIAGLTTMFLLLGFTATANAQQSTGSIRGTVEGSTSATIVEVTDVARGVSRSETPNASGAFRFDSLSVGTYEVVVRSGGTIVDSETVSVGLGSSVTVRMATTEAMIEEIVTTGQRISGLDTGIAETGLQISADELIKLPVQRDLQSVAMLAPGASLGDYRFGRAGQIDGIVSFSGASIAENTSFINGLNTTNFRTGVGFSKVPFEFYETFQVKTGGYSAKYGRSLGGVMNARSKSGSNDFKAGVNVYYEMQEETSPDTYAAANFLDDQDDATIDAYVSGPIIKDRLFYYLLYSDSNTSQYYAGSLQERAFDYEVDEGFYGAKLDAYITDNHHLEYTFFTDERTGIEGNFVFTGGQQQNYLGDTDYEEGGDNWIGTYTGNFGDVTVSASYGENEANRTTAPSSADLPTLYQSDAGGNLVAIGDWTTFLIDLGTDKREMTRIDVNWVVGDHDLSLGIDNEEMFAENFTINSGGIYWLLDPLNTYPPSQCTPAECPSGGSARRRTYSNGGEFESSSKAFYVQDVWEINQNWTVELGLRNESFENLNGDGGVFVKVDDQWAPRIAAVWDPTGDGSSKFFANYGLYYLPIAANTNIRMAGGETYIHDYFDYDGSQNADGTPTNLGAQFRQDEFGNGLVPDTRSVTDLNLEPMYQSEIILGYQRYLDSGIELGVKGIYRTLETTIEDVAIDAAVIDYYNSSGSWEATVENGLANGCEDNTRDCLVEDIFSGFHQYVLTNPGNDMRVYIPEQDETIDLTADQLRYPEAERQYGAIEFTFARPFDGGWGLQGSYTWSHSWGNHEGYVQSDIAQDDAGITQNFDQPGLTDATYGDLPNDRRHTFKVFGQYATTDALTLTGSYLYQSGRPVNCFGIHPTDNFAAAYGSFSMYCDGRFVKRGSSGTTPSLVNFNLGAQYRMELGNFDTLFALDVFNVFNAQNAISFNEDSTSENFMRIRQYQRPRFIRLSARIGFN